MTKYVTKQMLACSKSSKYIKARLNILFRTVIHIVGKAINISLRLLSSSAGTIQSWQVAHWIKLREIGKGHYFFVKIITIKRDVYIDMTDFKVIKMADLQSHVMHELMDN